MLFCIFCKTTIFCILNPNAYQALNIDLIKKAVDKTDSLRNLSCRRPLMLIDVSRYVWINRSVIKVCDPDKGFKRGAVSARPYRLHTVFYFNTRWHIQSSQWYRDACLSTFSALLYDSVCIQLLLCYSCLDILWLILRSWGSTNVEDERTYYYLPIRPRQLFVFFALLSCMI